jgi:hypothetical protein
MCERYDERLIEMQGRLDYIKLFDYCKQRLEKHPGFEMRDRLNTNGRRVSEAEYSMKYKIGAVEIHILLYENVFIFLCSKFESCIVNESSEDYLIYCQKMKVLFNRIPSCKGSTMMINGDKFVSYYHNFQKQKELIDDFITKAENKSTFGDSIANVERRPIAKMRRCSIM